MQKNFRLIPKIISTKLSTISSKKIIVAAIFEVTKKEIKNGNLKKFGIPSFSKGAKNSIIPKKRNGKYSKRNIDGREIVRRDLPKVMRQINLGERPIFGDWSKGSFDLSYNKPVLQKQQEDPKRISLYIEILEETQINNNTVFTLKIQVGDTLKTDSKSFKNDLLFYINLLQENVGKIDIFSDKATYDEFIGNVQVSWEILPIGERDALISQLMKSYRIPPTDIKKKIDDKRKFLDSLNPIKYVIGLGGKRRYFGAMFSEQLVVFENLDYGNAIYILSGNWKKNSQLSRGELRKKRGSEIEIVEHRNNWKKKVKNIVTLKLKTTL